MGSSNSNTQRLAFRYNSHLGVSEIQSMVYLTGAKPLLINPNGGNVGIGTFRTAYPFDVNGSVRINNTNTLNNKQLVLWDGNSNDNVAGACNFYGFGINSGVLRYQTESTGSHRFFAGTNNLAVLGNGGNAWVSEFLLSNSMTNALFTVNSNTLTIRNFSVGVYMAPGANAWTGWSDIRLKKNVKPLEYGLSVLDRLEPVRYDYMIDASSNSSRLGFVAQNVLTAVPEAVNGEGTEASMYGLQVTDLIPVCVNAIKELGTAVEGHRTEVEATSSGLDGLRSDLDAVRSQLDAVLAFLASKFPGETI